MNELKQAFEEIFRFPFRALPLPLNPLVRLGGDGALYGNEAARQRPILIQSDLDHFLGRPRALYFLVGFWGYGVNSYAFYYASDDGRSRIFFRLPYGGVYEDTELNGRKIGRFLPAFFAFESEQRRVGAKLLAVDSMGWGQYRATAADGSVGICNHSLFYCQEFFDGGLNFNNYLT